MKSVNLVAAFFTIGNYFFSPRPRVMDLSAKLEDYDGNVEIIISKIIIIIMQHRLAGFLC